MTEDSSCIMVMMTLFMVGNGRMAISAMSVTVLMVMMTLFMAGNGRMAISTRQ